MILAEEDWQVPALPPTAEACRNCGEARTGGVCTGCGLSAAEDAQVHEELRALIDPSLDLLGAAQAAAEAGRRLLALKLASAALADGQRTALARLLRLDLLQELGLLDLAAQDCRRWTQGEGARDPLAWSIQGEVSMALGRPSEALEGFDRALALDPEQPVVRARLAAVLLALDRYAQAREEAARVLREQREGPAVPVAREVLGRYLRRLMEQGDAGPIRADLEELDAHTREDAALSALRAWVDLRDGHPKAAALALDRAERLDRRCPLIAPLRAELATLEGATRKRPWWRWPG